MFDDPVLHAFRFVFVENLGCLPPENGMPPSSPTLLPGHHRGSNIIIEIESWFPVNCVSVYR